MKIANYTLLANGVKHFHLIAQPVIHELVQGVKVMAYGYNGSVPGPVIVVDEGDTVAITVENALPEVTSVHWHGLNVPNDVDGVPGEQGTTLISPGSAHTYQFTLHQHGTYMYHSHVETSIQELMGLAGMFIVRGREEPLVAVDAVFLLQEWAVQGQGRAQPVYAVLPQSMMFNYFTMNGVAYPDTTPIAVKAGDCVRLRLGNLSMDSHPMHLHGHSFRVTAADGNPIPASAQIYKNTMNVAPGETWNVEFFANNPGRWIFHCHKPHHTTNAHSDALGGMVTFIDYVH
nr:copper oxidase [Fictibacillus macauensis]